MHNFVYDLKRMGAIFLKMGVYDTKENDTKCKTNC